jgi:hypothetical protein
MHDKRHDIILLQEFSPFFFKDWNRYNVGRNPNPSESLEFDENIIKINDLLSTPSLLNDLQGKYVLIDGNRFKSLAGLSILINCNILRSISPICHSSYVSPVNAAGNILTKYNNKPMFKYTDASHINVNNNYLSDKGLNQWTLYTPNGNQGYPRTNLFNGYQEAKPAPLWVNFITKGRFKIRIYNFHNTIMDNSTKYETFKNYDLSKYDIDDIGNLETDFTIYGGDFNIRYNEFQSTFFNKKCDANIGVDYLYHSVINDKVRVTTRSRIDEYFPNKRPYFIYNMIMNNGHFYGQFTDHEPVICEYRISM